MKNIKKISKNLITKHDELTDEQLEHVCGGMRKEMFDIYATDLINNNLFYKQKEKQ